MSTNVSSRHTNRLSRESSPYLLQHAHNPVDWYPWGPEALAAARQQDKPIFLSVGYSTCYWCHVMERECFENEAIAAQMNRLFINIKVDREERPDVDQLYMTAVQLITQRGGWPMSVWLTPDLRPFYGGTYFPPANFVAALRGLEDAYRNRRDDVDKSATQITSILRGISGPRRPEKPLVIDAQAIERMMDRSVSDYDPRDGGFGYAPKFPRQTLLELLLVYLANSKASNSRRDNPRSMLHRTLDAMADGGIHEQLGGGFHRYSTDARWLVPHFEIMLYDNAMLAWVYAEARRQGGPERYANVASGIFDFVLRELTSPQGGFYTAFDAEVDGQEGLSYLWTADEIRCVLGNDDAGLFNRVYGLDRGPNFADPHHGSGIADKNILYLPQPLGQVGAEMGTSAEQLERKLAPMRQKLYQTRRQRKQPLLDTKVITSWNALMVRALAHGGMVLGEPAYIEAAARAAKFLLDSHRTADGTVYRASREGKLGHGGFLDDYSMLAQALLELSDATGQQHWKDSASEVIRTMVLKFGDETGGALFFSPKDDLELILPQKTAQDSPLPSGNAIAAQVLLKSGLLSQSRAIIGEFTQQLEDHCEGMSSMLQAALLDLLCGGPITVGAQPSTREAARPASNEQRAEQAVSVHTRWITATQLQVELRIAAGYHINAHEPGDSALVPTAVRAAQGDASVDYPAGEELAVSFSSRRIRVYSGTTLIPVRFDSSADPKAKTRLLLTYQACDENSCLPPVSRRIDVPPM